ncbi:hypothetical protein LCGC14_2330550 [marine sediment metagenome]|uniref:Uncharacterized protein n=1 Tax=marine sediment metagenome TaxID=412755 RepID=A0A0F9D2G1_9ZZZZ
MAETVADSEGAEELVEGGRAALGIAEGCLSLAGAAVLRIPAWRFGAAEALIAKAGRRSAKLGLEAPRLAAVGTSVRTWTEAGPGGVPRRRHESRVTIAVFGSAPKVGGFRFLARVEHTVAGNVVTRAPFGIEAGVDLSAYRTAAPDCAHCNAARRRKDTFVLKNGLYKVTFPVKAYRGFLDRPIERLGLVPDVSIRQNARDLAVGRDTVLQAARQHLSIPKTLSSVLISWRMAAKKGKS